MLTPVRLILAGAGLALALPLYAATTSPLPQTHRQGDVTYVAGGVGQGEAQAMKQAAVRYPLDLLFTAGKRGEYLADVHVAVKNQAGHTVLDVVADGPMLFAQLPAGRYHVKAEYEGHSMRRDIRVTTQGGHWVDFNWPHAA